jgi:alpha-ketoglutarate-dependent taurine dioxygenase
MPRNAACHQRRLRQIHACTAARAAATQEPASPARRRRHTFRKDVCGIEATLLERTADSSSWASTADGFAVVPLPPPLKLGAEVSGVDLTTVDWAAEHATGRRLREALHEHGLLIFRGQQGLTRDAQVALGEVLAGPRPIMVPDHYEDSVDPQRGPSLSAEAAPAPAEPELNFLGNVRPDGSWETVTGFVAGREAARRRREEFGPLKHDASLDSVGFEWHVDGSGSTHDRPFSMLYCLAAPDFGGETLWLSGYHALSLLDDSTRALAERLVVHYGVETGEIRQAAEEAGALQDHELAHFNKFGDSMMPDGTQITNVPAELVEHGITPTHTNPLVKAQ